MMRPVKILGFLCCWALLCWFLYAIQKIISTRDLSLHQRSALNIDKRPRLNETSLMPLIQPLMPNIPLELWEESKEKGWFSKTSCGRFPSIFDLKFNSKYWQQLDTPKGSLFLLNAFLDVRKAAPTPTVRIIGMLEGQPESIYCQLWFLDQSDPVVTNASLQDSLVYSTFAQPFFLHCPLPESHQNQTPASVSLAPQPCAVATNNLRVLFNPLPENQTKKDFAVCVKGLAYPDVDLSARLVEWVELLTALGAEKIIAYNLEVHPNMSKVLEHYSKVGIMDLTPLTLPGHQPNLPFIQTLYLKNNALNQWQNEVVPYNDCFYRNMYRFKYIAILDIDEVIMPTKHDSWSSMMEELMTASDPNTIGWNFRHVYFLDGMTEETDVEREDKTGEESQEMPAPTSNIPEHLHMLNHVFRSANHSVAMSQTKSLVSTEKTSVVFNHFPLASLDGFMTNHKVGIDIGQMHHYRGGCDFEVYKDCEERFLRHIVKDTVVWKWKKEVIRKSSNVLNKLGFI